MLGSGINSLVVVIWKNRRVLTFRPKSTKKCTKCKNIQIISLITNDVICTCGLSLKCFHDYLISENFRKSYVVDLANDVFRNFPREALMNNFPVMRAPIGWNEFPTIF